MRIRFHEIAAYGEKSGKCACGKRRKRRQKFYQTLNPFNKNAKGEPKTSDEIRAELKDRIAVWQSEPITCEACKQLQAA